MSEADLKKQTEQWLRFGRGHSLSEVLLLKEVFPAFQT